MSGHGLLIAMVSGGVWPMSVHEVIGCGMLKGRTGDFLANCFIVLVLLCGRQIREVNKQTDKYVNQ